MPAWLGLVAGALFTYVAVYYGLFRAVRCAWSGTLSGKTAVVTGNDFHGYGADKYSSGQGSSLWKQTFPQ